MNDRLYRSRSDRMLAGVAGGVAERFELDPSLVRVGWAILVILSGGIFLLIYIVMAIVVPEEPIGSDGGWTGTGGGSGAGGWSGTSGWSSSWPTSGASAPGPAAPPPGPPPALGPAGGDPQATPPAPADPAGPGSGAAAGPAGPGFAAPIAGGWTPASSNPSTPPVYSARDERRAARDARRAARRAGRGYGGDHPGAGGIIGGLILVAIGLFFLVRAVAPQLEIDRYWPAGLVVLGLVMVGLSIRRTPGGNGP